jgi:hypothetical protein
MSLTSGGIGGMFKGLGNKIRNGLNESWDDAFGDKKADPAMMASMPYFEQDRARLGGMLQGQSPFAGREWGGLISQLKTQSMGGGPSLASQEYQRASQDTH